MFGCITRLTLLILLPYILLSAVVIGAIVIYTDGFGSLDVMDLPTRADQAPAGVRVENPDEIAPGTVNEVITKREIFEDLPLPDQISTETPVVTTNFSLAVVFAIIFGILGTLINNLLRDQEGKLAAWLRYFYFDRVFAPFKMITGHETHRQGCLGAPVVLFVFACYGIIFALMEPGVNLLQPSGIQLAIVMALSVGLVSLAGDFARRQVVRIWGRTGQFGIYPANLGFALVTTAFSRLLSLTPGVMFGTPGGVDVDLKDQPRFREVVLAVTTLGVVVAFGALGWGLASLIQNTGDEELAGWQLEFVAPMAQLSLTIGLALFAVAIQTAFFEMVPLSLTMGAQVFRWNLLLWGALFVPVFFVFSHTMLNPDGEFLEAFENTPLVVLTVMTILLAALLAFLWVFLTYVDPPDWQERPPAPPSGGYSPQYPGYPPQGGYPPPSVAPPYGYPPQPPPADYPPRPPVAPPPPPSRG